ncbi:MAG: DUF488 family protein [Leptospirales bacterium]
MADKKKKEPKYFRQKFLLALLQKFGGKLHKTDLQKYLFLYNQEFTDKPHYYFLPYKFGPFSFQAYADVRRLNDLGHLANEDHIEKVDTYDYTASLHEKDQKALIPFFEKYCLLKGNALIKYIYERYPYYSIKSEIKERILGEKSSGMMPKESPAKTNAEFFTMGYEGITVDQYLNNIVQQEISAVIDVRKNPISMKYGFSKTQLSKMLGNIGVNYQHMPDLGIESASRQDLSSFGKYQQLFDEYEQSTLNYQHKAINAIAESYYENKRVMLTCFEKDYNYCHRSRVSNAIEKKLGIETKHL